MDTLYENLLSLCEERNITGAKMCTDIGLSKSLMTGLKKGRRAGISMETAQKIADYFGVSVDRVLGNEQKEKPTLQMESELSDIKRDATSWICGKDDETVARIIAAAKAMLGE